MDFGFWLQSHIAIIKKIDSDSGAKPKSAKFHQSNFTNFDFIPQTHFLIFFFFIVTLYDFNQKSKSIYMSLF